MELSNVARGDARAGSGWFPQDKDSTGLPGMQIGGSGDAGRDAERDVYRSAGNGPGMWAAGGCEGGGRSEALPF